MVRYSLNSERLGVTDNALGNGADLEETRPEVRPAVGHSDHLSDSLQSILFVPHGRRLEQIDGKLCKLVSPSIVQIRVFELVSQDLEHGDLGGIEDTRSLGVDRWSSVVKCLRRSSCSFLRLTMVAALIVLTECVCKVSAYL